MGSEKKAVRGKKDATRALSLEVASKGIVTGHDFANFMSALMSDLISGTVSPGVGNAACNAGGKLLKVVEMQMRFGTADAGGQKVLKLALNNPLLGAEPKGVQ